MTECWQTGIKNNASTILVTSNIEGHLVQPLVAIYPLNCITIRSFLAIIQSVLLEQL